MTDIMRHTSKENWSLWTGEDCLGLLAEVANRCVL